LFPLLEFPVPTRYGGNLRDLPHGFSFFAYQGLIEATQIRGRPSRSRRFHSSSIFMALRLASASHGFDLHCIGRICCSSRISDTSIQSIHYCGGIIYYFQRSISNVPLLVACHLPPVFVPLVQCFVSHLGTFGFTYTSRTF
jgi:hypothetical protein